MEVQRGLKLTQAENFTLKHTTSQLHWRIKRTWVYSYSQGLVERTRKTEKFLQTDVIEEQNENQEKSEQKVNRGAVKLPVVGDELRRKIWSSQRYPAYRPIITMVVFCQQKEVYPKV